MDLLILVLIGIGLSMDCFAVSLAVGSTTKSRLPRVALIIALCFGGFQAGMTVLGWLAGISVIGFLSAYDHWIAFILLLVVGGKMMWEGVQGEEEEAQTDIFRFIPLVMLSLATSIDALAVGVSFGVLRTAVLMPALIIGIVCCAISFAGVVLGEKLEDLLGNRMEIAGGLILILMGVRILAEHLIP
jgi:manganese efflux pump family protein